MEQKSNSGIVQDLLELAERTNKAVYIFNLHKESFNYINPAFEVISNKISEDVRKRPALLWDTVHPEDKEYVKKHFEGLVNQEKRNIKIEFRILMPGAVNRWILLSAHYINSDSDPLIVGFAEDITELKDNISNIQKFASKKDSVLEILAHDLAGPLSSISAASTILTEQLKELDDPQSERLISMISKTSERSIRLIREFVKQEFLETTTTGLIKRRVDLVQMAREVIHQYKNSEKDIAKNFKLVTSSEKVYVEIDDYKFNQVINNLISNSIKFTHDWGNIVISIVDSEETVLLSVADNGIGIPEVLHEELFEKFTKARRPGLKGEPSVGLGMSIIKTIVEWHEGRIWFESEEDKGSTFYIELPGK